jgi:hypothetical protein
VNINNKNLRLKESLLVIISRLQEEYFEELKVSVNPSSICTTVSVLLGDPQARMRQLAIDTLASLYCTYGEVRFELLLWLGSGLG